jgi:hypothetical protein
MSIRMVRTRKFGACSAICRHSAACSLHSTDVIIAVPRTKTRAILTRTRCFVRSISRDASHFGAHSGVRATKFRLFQPGCRNCQPDPSGRDRGPRGKMCSRSPQRIDRDREHTPHPRSRRPGRGPIAPAGHRACQPKRCQSQTEAKPQRDRSAVAQDTINPRRRSAACNFRPSISSGRSLLKAISSDASGSGRWHRNEAPNSMTRGIVVRVLSYWFPLQVCRVIMILSSVASRSSWRDWVD